MALVLLGVLAAALLAGCSKPAPEVTSAWPVANSERTVPKPPEPVRWPYTGKEAAKSTDIRQRPLSIKIENSAASRPQTGIGSADVVYETISEGGITRFNCIFHSNVPSRVGPVRSARLSDLWVVSQYDALFLYSGASSSVNSRIGDAKLPVLSHDREGEGALYSRSSARSAPHNLYLDTTKAEAAAKARGYKTQVDLEPLQFEKRSTEATSPIEEITIPFSPANTVRWDWDEGAYARYNNGRAHMDEGLGKQVTADNVVVMWAKYEPVSRDKVGSTTFNIVLGGKGRVSVFREGQRFDGTWYAERDAPPVFKDADGRPIRLAQGRTWFQVIPLNGSITMK
jgi:hypothetical protein